MLEHGEPEQIELFVVDVLDVTFSDMQSMEFPLYSVSKKPEKRDFIFEHNDTTIEFKASEQGLPTIYDKDLIVYAISHVVKEFRVLEKKARENAKKANVPFSIDDVVVPSVTFDAQEFLIFANRSTGGDAYENLVLTIERLTGSRIRTNMKIGGVVSDEWRHLVGNIGMESKEKTRRDGTKYIVPDRITVDVGTSLQPVVRAYEVLALSRDYFKLKPTNRRVYELARKHTGQQSKWAIGVDKLKKKVGSKMANRNFRLTIKEMAKEDNLPDYKMEYVPHERTSKLDQVVFRPRSEFRKAYKAPERKKVSLPALSPSTVEEAKSLLSDSQSGVDIYTAEVEWREYHKNNPAYISDHNKAFLGWCKKYLVEPSKAVKREPIILDH